MPQKNLISNIGISNDSTHYSGSLKTLPSALRRIFTMERYELEFPLKHPKYIIEDVSYKERFYRTNAWNHPWIKLWRPFEQLFLSLRYGEFSAIVKAVKNRVGKWLKG